MADTTGGDTNDVRAPNEMLIVVSTMVVPLGQTEAVNDDDDDDDSKDSNDAKDYKDDSQTLKKTPTIWIIKLIWKGRKICSQARQASEYLQRFMNEMRETRTMRTTPTTPTTTTSTRDTNIISGIFLFASGAAASGDLSFCSQILVCLSL